MHLSLTLLGPFQAELDGQPVAGFESTKVRALLAYLAAAAGRPYRREALIGLLWPESPDQVAFASLRNALSNLRRAVGDGQARPPFLLVSPDTIQFNAASDYQLDVADFERKIREARRRDQTDDARLCLLASSVQLYRGSFLEGFSIRDSPTFEEWQLFTRAQLAQEMLSALQRLAGLLEDRGEYEQALLHTRRQLELEPWDEQAHQQAMRLLGLSGQRSAALAQYAMARGLLASELGVEPAPETTALYESIRNGALGHRATEQVTRESAGATPLVAREHELAKLEGWLDLALAGHGRVALAIGDAGSGKTTLLARFSRRAMETRAAVLVAGGKCNAHAGVGDSYLPFREIMQLLAGDVEAGWACGTIAAEHARRLRALVPTMAQALVELGPDLVDVLVPGMALMARAEALAPAGAPWRARLDELVRGKAAAALVRASLPQPSLFEQVANFLRAIALRAPLILLLDDLQWADAGSVSLLFHLGRRLAGSRILIVGAYRPGDLVADHTGQRHPLQSIVHEFQRDFGDICVDLDRAGGRSFVDALLDAQPNRLDAPFRDTLTLQTGGHALFTVEMLRCLRERGDLVQDEAGHWIEGPSLNWEKLPARVEAVIAERISRLPRTWQRTLSIASVEGEEFTAEVIARIQGADEAEVLGRLSGPLSQRHALVHAVGLQRVGGQRLSLYRFRRSMVQKYLYSHLDEVTRAHLHEAIGRALQALYSAPGVEGGPRAASGAQRLRRLETPGIREKAAG